ncbi:MAG: outer membrane protein assembly factor BamA [Puniceicoccales bacterium]|jgi:outer membrane protein insertion porin family|nr:outer membrane protein assembly factor BamA [Puniceicoccales bacterium]
MKFRHHFSFFLGLFFLFGHLLQANPEGKRIQSVAFTFKENTPTIPEDFLIAHILLKKDEPFKSYLADRSIQSLHATNLFSGIAINTDEKDDGITVTFQLETLPKIHALYFKGNKKISTSTLLKKIQSHTGQSVQESRLHEDAQRLQKFYREKGFPFIQAGYRIDTPAVNANHERDVFFLIDEGSKYRIQKIDFIGNAPLKPSKLHKAMMTKTWNIFSWLTKRGFFLDEIFQHDLEILQNIFRDSGYLDVHIAPEEVIFQYLPKGSLRILIVIQKGEPYCIGNISFPQTEIFNLEELQKTLDLVPGQIYSPSGIAEARERIQDIYGSKGYLQTEVSLISTLSNDEEHTMDLQLEIEEGSLTSLEDIHIRGNTKTKNKVILRELSLAPGDSLDTIQMRTSQQRLHNTHFFEEVIIQPEDCHSLAKKDLSIQVKEKNTGKVSLGGAISAANNAILFLKISQPNFDLFGSRTHFQGAGQKFNAQLQLGTRNNSISMSFEEPWLFDRELTFGCELFATYDRFKSSDFNYNGPSYHERHVGTEIYFRKALWEYWVGKFSYRIEQQRIGDVGDKAPFELKQDVGRRSISRVGFSMERDTRDDLLIPTHGSYIHINNEIFGGIFGGSTHFHRLETFAARWFSIHPKNEQILTLSGHFGSLSAFRHRRIPYTERFFLGGSDEMKGFGSRDIGPHDAEGYVIGGNTLFHTCAEYSFELLEPIRFAVFGELGYVNARKFDLSSKNYHSDYGFGLRILVMGAPLRLDFGFPAHKAKETQKHKVQFNFSFSTPF